tara:strand:- start:526 stop:642 length:117 start_codon:yes stop_codon:yes gene_type:complete
MRRRNDEHCKEREERGRRREKEGIGKGMNDRYIYPLKK